MHSRQLAGDRGGGFCAVPTVFKHAQAAQVFGRAAVVMSCEAVGLVVGTLPSSCSPCSHQPQLMSLALAALLCALLLGLTLTACTKPHP